MKTNRHLYPGWGGGSGFTLTGALAIEDFSMFTKPHWPQPRAREFDIVMQTLDYVTGLNNF